MSKQTETLTDPTRRDFLGTASGAGAMLAAGATGVACQTSLDGSAWAPAYEGVGAALAIELVAPTAANGRVYSVQPARFLRLVVAAGVTSAQAVVVVRRSAEAALS